MTNYVIHLNIVLVRCIMYTYSRICIFSKYDSKMKINLPGRGPMVLFWWRSRLGINPPPFPPTNIITDILTDRKNWDFYKSRILFVFDLQPIRLCIYQEAKNYTNCDYTVNFFFLKFYLIFIALLFYYRYGPNYVCN